MATRSPAPPAVGLPRVGAEIDLASVLARRVRASPARPAVTFEGTTRTFAEVQDRVLRTAGVLREQGVGPGDRVAYLGTNHPAILEALFATAWLGAVFVPLNFRLTAPELACALEQSGTSVLLADEARRCAPSSP